MINFTGVYRQFYATIAASMSIFISGMWLGWPCSAVDKFLKHETDVDIGYEELSWVVCMMDLGNSISPLFAGYLMDRVGRRQSIALLGPLFCVSWALPLCVHTAWALYVARLMAGLGKGMSYTVVPVFLGEIAGVDIRGALGTVFTVQLSGGVLFEVMIGPWLSYRALSAVSVAVPVLFIAMFVCVPESPYYLLKVGRREDARRCLRWYRAGAAEIEVDTELRCMEASVRKDMESQATFGELLANRRNRRALAVVVSTCVAQRAGGISSLTAYPALILPDPAPLIGKFGYITLFAFMLVLVNFAGMALVDRAGRKPLLLISELGLGAVTALFALYYYTHGDPTAAAAAATASPAYWPYACYLAFSVMFGIGIEFIPVVFLGEMFPVNVRSHCSAVASVSLAFSSFVSNKIFIMVSHTFGYHVMFVGFTIVNLGSAWFAHSYAVETTGKTFQEIQDILERSVRVNEGGNKKTVARTTVVDEDVL